MQIKSILAMMFVLIVSIGVVSAADIGGDVVNVEPTFSEITINSPVAEFVVTDDQTCDLEFSAVVTDMNGVADITNAVLRVQQPDGTFVCGSSDVTMTPIDDFSVTVTGTATVPTGTIEGIYQLSVGVTDTDVVSYHSFTDFDLYNHEAYYVQDFVIAGAVPGQANTYNLVIVNDHGNPETSLTDITLDALTINGQDISSRLTFDYTAGTAFDENGLITVPASFNADGLLAGTLTGQLTVTLDEPVL